MEHRYLEIIRNTLLCGIYIKMPKTHRDQYTDTKIELHIKTFYGLRPDLKICWFDVSQTGLQETCSSENVFDTHS